MSAEPPAASAHPGSPQGDNAAAPLSVRPAVAADLPRLTEIYNHFVVHTPVTFDLEPYTVERRAAWFEQFAATGRYRLMVAERNGQVDGYAGSLRFRPKAAYDTTVETTIYCWPHSRGLGGPLYRGLFDALAGEDIHRVLAGYTLPNPASAALHHRLGFTPVGIFRAVGRKFGRYWDVAWTERPLQLPTQAAAPSPSLAPSSTPR